MSFNNGLLNAVYDYVEGLENKPKRCDNVNHILQITSRPGMSVYSADSHIVLVIKITVPAVTTMRMKRFMKATTW